MGAPRAGQAVAGAIVTPAEQVVHSLLAAGRMTANQARIINNALGTLVPVAIDVAPGQAVIFTLPQGVPAEGIQHIMVAAKALFPDNTVVVLDAGYACAGGYTDDQICAGVVAYRQMLMMRVGSRADHVAAFRDAAAQLVA